MMSGDAELSLCALPIRMKQAQFIFLCLTLLGCEQRHRGEVYDFPEGFHGWAVIVWGVTNQPPCQKNHGDIIVRFPPDGVVITSTKLVFDAERSGSHFLDAAGRRLASRPNLGFAGNGFIHEDKSDRDMDFTQVFIGTKAEYHAVSQAPQVQKLWDAGISSHER